jgi:hypothetical protein
LHSTVWLAGTPVRVGSSSSSSRTVVVHVVCAEPLVAVSVSVAWTPQGGTEDVAVEAGTFRTRPPGGIVPEAGLTATLGLLELHE